MIDKLRKRMNEEQGFTLIELLVVIIIIGILLAIAVPSYLGFRDRASKSAAQANVRSAIPSVEAFFADNGTYAGLANPVDGTAADPDGPDNLPDGWLSYDAGLKASTVAAQDNTTGYCIYSKVGGFEYFKSGPSGQITQDADASDDCTA